MLHVYENHLGGYYTSETQLTIDEEYCEQCGDSDWYLGAAETEEEAEQMYEEYMEQRYE